MTRNIVWKHSNGTYSVSHIVNDAEPQHLATHFQQIGVMSADDTIVGFDMPDDFIQKVLSIRTIEDVRRLGDAQVSRLVEDTAKTAGFDSMIAAASYVTSAVKEFKADAVALVKWRDKVWDAWLQVRNSEDQTLLSTTLSSLPSYVK